MRLRNASLVRFCLLLLVVSSIIVDRAHARQSIAFQFSGRARTSAIEGVPVTFNAPFTGYFSYDLAAPVVDQSGSARTYEDPTASLAVTFDGVSFHSIGAVVIEISRINTPFFSINSFRLSADIVASDGTSAPIDNLSIAFVNANDFLPPDGLPESIDASLITGNVQVSSPDIPVGGNEPPRTGFIAGSFDDYSRLAPCVAGDLRMQWLLDMAAILRLLPPSVFAGNNEIEQALTRSRIALLADTAALGIANCDLAATGNTLSDLAGLIIDPTDPLVVNGIVADALLEPIFAILLSL